MSDDEFRTPLDSSTPFKRQYNPTTTEARFVNLHRIRRNLNTAMSSGTSNPPPGGNPDDSIAGIPPASASTSMYGDLFIKTDAYLKYCDGHRKRYEAKLRDKTAEERKRLAKEGRKGWRCAPLIIDLFDEDFQILALACEEDTDIYHELREMLIEQIRYATSIGNTWLDDDGNPTGGPDGTDDGQDQEKEQEDGGGETHNDQPPQPMNQKKKSILNRPETQQPKTKEDVLILNKKKSPSTQSLRTAGLKLAEKRRQSYGAIPASEAKEDSGSEEDESFHTYKQKQMNFGTRQPTSSAMIPYTPIIQYVAAEGIAKFDGTDNSVAVKFIQDFEALTSGYPDAQRIEHFRRYLLEPASHWFENMLLISKKTAVINEHGYQSNGLNEMTWPLIKDMFFKRYKANVLQDFMTASQKPGELGTTFLERMCLMHTRSGLKFDEPTLATHIIDRMTSPFSEEFRHREFQTIMKLRDSIETFEKRRAYLLAKRNTENRRTRLAAITANEDVMEVDPPVMLPGPTAMDSLVKEVKAAVSNEVKAVVAMAKVQMNNPTNNRTDQRGRGRNNNFRGNRQPMKPRFDGYCFRCDKRGHRATECRTYPMNRSNNNYNNHNHNGRGHGRGRGRHHYNPPRQFKGESRDRQNSMKKEVDSSMQGNEDPQ